MLGDNIRRIREERNMSQRELAKSIDISHEYLNRIEKGKNNNPSLEILQKLANILNCSVNDLTNEDNVEDKEPSIEQLLQRIYNKNKNFKTSLTNQMITELLEKGLINPDGTMDKEIQRLIVEVAQIQAQLEAMKKGQS